MHLSNKMGYALCENLSILGGPLQWGLKRPRLTESPVKSRESFATQGEQLICVEKHLALTAQLEHAWFFHVLKEIKITLHAPAIRSGNGKSRHVRFGGLFEGGVTPPLMQSLTKPSTAAGPPSGQGRGNAAMLLAPHATGPPLVTSGSDAKDKRGKEREKDRRREYCSAPLCLSISLSSPPPSLFLSSWPPKNVTKSSNLGARKGRHRSALLEWVREREREREGTGGSPKRGME